MTTQQESLRGDVWILSRQNGGVIQPISFELLARARDLADKNAESGECGFQVHALLAGPPMPESELQRLIAYGADQVHAIESEDLTSFSADLYAKALLPFIRRVGPMNLLAGADSQGRALMPYLARLLATGLTADCTELYLDHATGLLLQTRPAIGGHIMATIQCKESRPQMATVRPRSRRPRTPDASRQGTIFRIVPESPMTRSTVRVRNFLPDPVEKSIEDAERIVVVGRGIKKAENLPKIFEFAKAVDAAVGATREVVDRGWLDYACQIGLSGRTVTPRLYIGLGVSGAIQHMAGMQTAETIIAVNRDPDAPIFHIADFGIVGDLFDVLPELITRLRTRVH
ncbi:MAG: electron transfer flavoprotein subunit alpha/FixB family protein [Planctomycetia bacterium]|nr:electron transfer flavoprotein subunit alpha/FixB family protein [Planctomycetia bacterium]